MTSAPPEHAPATSPPVPLRHNRDFLLLWVGQAVSALGSNISITAYPLLVLVLTGSAASAGLVGFLGSLPYALLQLPAGALVDRWDRRRIMRSTDRAGGYHPVRWWLAWRDYRTVMSNPCVGEERGSWRNGKLCSMSTSGSTTP